MSMPGINQQTQSLRHGQDRLGANSRQLSTGEKGDSVFYRQLAELRSARRSDDYTVASSPSCKAPSPALVRARAASSKATPHGVDEEEEQCIEARIDHKK